MEKDTTYVAEEAVRDLVRCRDDIRRDVLRWRHRVLKLLARHGRAYLAGKNWSQAHWRWIREQRFDLPPLQRAFEATVFALEQALARQAELDKELEALATTASYRAPVGWLRCFRGIDTLSAIILVAEVVDFQRFRRPGVSHPITLRHTALAIRHLTATTTPRYRFVAAFLVARTQRGRARAGLLISRQERKAYGVIRHVARRSIDREFEDLAVARVRAVDPFDVEALYGFRHILELRAADILQPDIGTTGGIMVFPPPLSPPPPPPDPRAPVTSNP